MTCPTLMLRNRPSNASFQPWFCEEQPSSICSRQRIAIGRAAGGLPDGARLAKRRKAILWRREKVKQPHVSRQTRWRFDAWRPITRALSCAHRRQRLERWARVVNLNPSAQIGPPSLSSPLFVLLFFQPEARLLPPPHFPRPRHLPPSLRASLTLLLASNSLTGPLLSGLDVIRTLKRQSLSKPLYQTKRCPPPNAAPATERTVALHLSLRELRSILAAARLSPSTISLTTTKPRAGQSLILGDFT